MRPGDPLADLIFNACMTGFIKELCKCQLEDGLLVSMQELDGNPQEPARTEDDQDRGDLDPDRPTWVDDHAVFTVAWDSNGAVHNIRTIMVTLENVAAWHGFSLNTKKGKTECVITFAEKSIVEARRALDWQEDHAQLQCGDNGTLRLVDSYKHLGTLHDKHLRRIPEVVRRNTLLPLPVWRLGALACVDGVLFSVVVSSVAARVAFLQCRPCLVCSVLLPMKPGPGGRRMRSSARSSRRHPRGLSCRRLDCDSYHDFFATLRPRYVPSCGHPA